MTRSLLFRLLVDFRWLNRADEMRHTGRRSTRGLNVRHAGKNGDEDRDEPTIRCGSILSSSRLFARCVRRLARSEIEPFSIFESMPVEIPAAAPSSATVKSRSFRSLRTSIPIPDSSDLGISVGAREPVNNSLLDGLLRWEVFLDFF